MRKHLEEYVFATSDFGKQVATQRLSKENEYLFAEDKHHYPLRFGKGKLMIKEDDGEWRECGTVMEMSFTFLDD